MFWLTFGCGSVRGHGVSWSRDEVGAIDVSAQNLTNTRWSSAPVAGSLRVRQPCGDDDEMANAIDARERQRHLDNAISDDSNGDFLCGSLTMRREQWLETNDTQRLLADCWVRQRSPHERDTRIDTEKTRYQRC